MDKREAAIVIEGVGQHLGWCGCGVPEAAADWLRRALAAHPAWDHRDAQVPTFGEDVGREYVLRYMLDHAGLTNHGGSVGGAWLTERGERVLAALQVEGAIEEWRERDNLFEPGEAIAKRWREWGRFGSHYDKF